MIVVLDGQISALIEERQYAVHVLCRRIKFSSVCHAAVNRCDIRVKLPDLADQKNRCSCVKPVVVQLAGVHSREKAERVVNPR